MLAPTHRGCGTPVRSRLGGMQKRRALRNGGSISGRSLTVPPSGGRRGRMRERPGRVPWMLGPLEMLAPRLAGRVARVTTGNELRGTVQVGRRHHRRLLRLAAVSHFSPALLVPSPPRSMSNRHTHTHTHTHARDGRHRSLGQHSAEASCFLAQSPLAQHPSPRISFGNTSLLVFKARHRFSADIYFTYLYLSFKVGSQIVDSREIPERGELDISRGGSLFPFISSSSSSSFFLRSK